jgi:uncharacterized membrane protein YqgA involved in biofilm formation
VTGTLLNAAAVLAGTTVGTLLGDRLPERVRDIALQGVGLVTLLIGTQMALQAQNLLIVLASMVIGGVIGEVLRIEDGLDAIGRRLEQRFGAPSIEALDAASPQTLGAATPQTETPAARFVRGFVTSSLVFCVGPLTILGSVQDGLLGDPRLLTIKSLLDGFTSIAFGSTLGRGVYFSVLGILIYQGGLSLGARALGAGIPDPGHNPGVVDMTAVGGLLILGIGFTLLDIKSIRVGNFLPALGLAPVLNAVSGAVR